MPDTCTPGQIAYEAHAHFWDRDLLCTPPWARLPPMHRESWDAAAQAVRTAYKDELAAAWQEGVRLGQETPQ
jgi:hypothetical protein